MALFFLRFLAFALLMAAALFLGMPPALMPPALWIEQGEIGAAAVAAVVGLAAATGALAVHLSSRKRSSDSDATRPLTTHSRHSRRSGGPTGPVPPGDVPDDGTVQLPVRRDARRHLLPLPRALLTWLGIATVAEGELTGVGGLTVAAALCYPGRNAAVAGQDLVAGVRRHRALKREERRLAALAPQLMPAGPAS